MKCHILAAVGCAVAFGARSAFADEYTVPVPTDAVLVTESPYATGGDFIYKLPGGSEEYVHVYTNAATSAFTPLQNLKIRALVLGGGAAGASGDHSLVYAGGGGAGAFYECTNVSVAAEVAIPVTVGAGGASVNTSNTKSNGGNSVFGEITAYGGQGVGAHNGGAASTIEGVGMGNAGGTGSSKVYSGSGGGAGAPGVAEALLGGEGLSSDITGAVGWYCGGGNGASPKSTPMQDVANLAGGGLGYSPSRSATAGRANSGSGGGGGYNKTTASGAGGSGLVVVRYSGWTGSVPVAPSVDSAKGASLTTAEISGYLASTGDDAATITVSYWPTGNTGAAKSVEAGVVEGTGMFGGWSVVLDDLVEGTVYAFEVDAENSKGISAVVDGSFETDFPDCGATGGEKTLVGVKQVHKFLTDGVFHLPHAVDVSVLVVGGGACGGSSPHKSLLEGAGGGGGGGVVYVSSLRLEPGDYAVIVGAGGKWADAVKKYVDGNGKSSSFGDLVVAHGGGIGGRYNETANAGSVYVACGGGGNGYSKTAGGVAGFADEGFSGGNGVSPAGGGGGGGAGGVGGNAFDSNGGAGGVGMAFNFYGYDEYYGGGGGGAAKVGGAGGVGGSGVGGDGGYLASGSSWIETCAGGNGKDGYGGGGGGGMGTSNAPSVSQPGGDGGSGVVIVSYVDYSQMSDGNEPTIGLPTVTGVAATEATVSLGVVGCGGNASELTLTAWYGLAEDDLSESVVIADHAGVGDGVYVLSHLLPARIYYCKIVADNGLDDGVAESAVFPFTTTKLIEDAVSFVHDQGAYYFTFNVGELTPEKVTALLMLSTDGGETYAVADQWDVTESGVNTKAHLFDPALLGTSYHYRIDLVCEDGGAAWTSSNEQALSASAFYAEDEAVYGWIGGEEGYWDDPANWESSLSGGVTRGYPVRGSRADFLGDAQVTVRFRKPEICTYLGVNVDNLDLTLLGEGTDAALTCVTPVSGCGGNPFGEGSVCTVDGVAFNPALSGAWAFREGQRLIVRNGAVVNVGQALNPGAAADTYVLITDGGRINASGYAGGRGGQFLIDGGIFDMSSNDDSRFDPFDAGDCQTEVTIGRDGSRLIASQIYSDNNFTIRFDIPVGGYTTVPISGGGDKIGCNHTSGGGRSDSGKIITFTCVKRSGIRADRKAKYVTLVSKTSALAYTRVDNAKPVTPGSELFFASSASSTDAITAETGDAACIRYHHVPQKLGTAIILR